MSGAGSRSTPRPVAVRCIVSTDRSTDASWRALADVAELDDRDDAVDDPERRQPAADFDVRHPGGEAGGDHVLDRARPRGRRDGATPQPGPAADPVLEDRRLRGQLGRDRAVAGAVADLGVELGERGAEPIEVGGQLDVVRRTHRCRRRARWPAAARSTRRPARDRRVARRARDRWRRARRRGGRRGRGARSRRARR